MNIDIGGASVGSGVLMVYGIKAAQILITFIIGFILLKILIKIAGKALEKSSLDAALHRFIISAIRIGGLVLIVLAILPQFGVDITVFITALGAAGVAVALALKDSLANVAGGIMILVTKPFGQGDLVQIGDTLGNVNEIDILSTSLKTIDNRLVTVPNGMVSTSVITNYTRTEDRRVECTFCVAFDADMNKAKAAASEVAAGCPLLSREGHCVTGVLENGDCGIMLQVLVWCSPEKYWDAKYYMEENVKKAFDDAGVMLAVAEMNINISR